MKWQDDGQYCAKPVRYRAGKVTGYDTAYQIMGENATTGGFNV